MSQERRAVPTEAVSLYNDYIHGHISRRAFLDGVKRFAVAGVTAGAIVEALMPNYAAAQQVSRSDDRISASHVSVPSPNGFGSIRGYLVRPVSADKREKTVAKLPGILVIHENRGLNPHIEDIARRLALANFMAFAPDALTSGRRLSGRRRQGRRALQQAGHEQALRGLRRGRVLAQGAPRLHRQDRRHRFLLRRVHVELLAVRLGADLAAAVPFYGGGPPIADVPKIKAAVLVQHGELDKRLVDAWPAYEAALKAAGVTYEGHVYPGAGHGFNCDATPERYNKAVADEAWTRTIDWFNKYVRA